MLAQAKMRQGATLVPTCRCTVARRGPNWLFLKVSLDGDACGVAERLWEIARAQFVYRLVVEFDGDGDAALGAELGMQLGALCERLTERGGALRLCGLSDKLAQSVVGESGCPRLHNHATTHDAVWCSPCHEHGAHHSAAQHDTVVASFEEETWVTPGHLPRLAK